MLSSVQFKFFGFVMFLLVKKTVNGSCVPTIPMKRVIDQKGVKKTRLSNFRLSVLSQCCSEKNFSNCFETIANLLSFADNQFA